ncbi:MAG: hypothetical protein Q8K36_06125 [Alphaproteobacteria bacterium]|nr:hypothetical protein [Alphaproteobacteria bacterium]
MLNNLKNQMIVSVCLLGTIAMASDELIDAEAASATLETSTIDYTPDASLGSIDLDSIIKTDLLYPEKPSFMTSKGEEQAGSDVDEEQEFGSRPQKNFKTDKDNAHRIGILNHLLYISDHTTPEEVTMITSSQVYAHGYVERQLQNRPLLTGIERSKFYFDQYTKILESMGWARVGNGSDSKIVVSRNVNLNILSCLLGGLHHLSSSACAAFKEALTRLIGVPSDQPSYLFQYLATKREKNTSFSEIIKKDGIVYLHMGSFHFEVANVQMNVLSSLFGKEKMDLTQYFAYFVFALSKENWAKNEDKIMNIIPHDLWMAYDLL